MLFTCNAKIVPLNTYDKEAMQQQSKNEIDQPTTPAAVPKEEKSSDKKKKSK